MRTRGALTGAMAVVQVQETLASLAAAQGEGQEEKKDEKKQ